MTRTNQGVILLVLFTFLILGTMAYAAPTIAVKFNGNALPSSGYLDMNTPVIDVTITPDTGVDLNASTFLFLLDGIDTGATLNGTTATYTVPAGSPLADGNHEVIITILDINQQSGVPVATPFKIDTQIPVLTASVTPASGGTWLTQNNQQFVASCTDANPCTVEYKVPSQNSGNYQTYTTDVNFTNNNETLTVRSLDAAGNPSAEQTFELKIDTSAPSDFIVSAPTGFTNSTSPSFTVTASDSVSGLAKVIVHCDGGSNVEFTMTTSPLTITTFNVTQNGCPSGDGSRTVQFKVVDNASNATADINKTIQYDGSSPSIPSGLAQVSVDGSSVSFSWNASTDPLGGSGIDNYLVYRHTSDSIGGASQISSPTATSYSNTGLSSCTDYYYWVKSHDNAGNTSSASATFHVKTTGCSTNDSSDNDSSGDSGGGGGGSGGVCNVVPTFKTTHLYAGENTPFLITTATSQVWTIRANIPGKIGTQDLANGTGKEASTTIQVPNQIGKSIMVFYKYSGGGCASSKSYTIEDPSTKSVPASTDSTSDGSETTNSDSGETTPENETPTLVPVNKVISFSLDGISSLLADAGFNAENTAMRESITSLLIQWKVTSTIKVIPGTTSGKYKVQLAFHMEDTTKNGTIKIIERVPKSFANLASELESNYPMTVLQDDPLIQFEISGLTEGQSIDVTLTSKGEYSIEEANTKAQTIAGDATNPPLLFASGTAAASLNGGDGFSLLSGLTGLASGAGSAAPFILGFIVFAGIILVSVRVVRASLAGADNPILRSAGGAGRQ